MLCAKPGKSLNSKLNISSLQSHGKRSRSWKTLEKFLKWDAVVLEFYHENCAYKPELLHNFTVSVLAHLMLSSVVSNTDFIAVAAKP